MFVKYALLSAAAAMLPAGMTAAQDIAPNLQTTPPVDAAGAPVPDVTGDPAAAAIDPVEDAADGVADAAPPSDVPADMAADAAAGGAIVAVTEADFAAGAMVHDPAGGMVGTIESVDAEGAVVATGANRVKIPIASFGRNDRGLVIALTRAELDAQAAASAG